MTIRMDTSNGSTPQSRQHKLDCGRRLGESFPLLMSEYLSAFNALAVRSQYIISPPPPPYPPVKLPRDSHPVTYREKGHGPHKRRVMKDLMQCPARGFLFYNAQDAYRELI